MRNRKRSDDFNDFFVFSPEITHKIRDAYKRFEEESRKIATESNVSKEFEKIVISQIVDELIEQALEKNEQAQTKNYSKKLRKEFKKKILQIISSDEKTNQ